MGNALLKRVNYSRAIIAGNALYFEQTFWDFSRYAQNFRRSPRMSKLVSENYEYNLVSIFEITLYMEPCFSSSYANINSTNHNNVDNEYCCSHKR